MKNNYSIMIISFVVLYSNCVLANTNTKNGTLSAKSSVAISSSSASTKASSSVSSIDSSPTAPTPVLPSTISHKPLASSLPDSVRIETCDNQAMFCDNICGVENSSALVNTCNSDSLIWACQCKDGRQPNTTAYTFPVEFVVCTEQLRACQTKCDGNSLCSHNCETSRNCTAKDKNDGKTTTSKMAQATKTPSIFSGSNSNYQNIIFYGGLVLASMVVL